MSRCEFLAFCSNNRINIQSPSLLYHFHRTLFTLSLILHTPRVANDLIPYRRLLYLMLLLENRLKYISSGEIVLRIPLRNCSSIINWIDAHPLLLFHIDELHHTQGYSSGCARLFHVIGASKALQNTTHQQPTVRCSICRESIKN